MNSRLQTALDQAVKRMGEASAIALVLADAPEWDALGSAVALERGLKKIGKAVSVFATPMDNRRLLPAPALAAIGAEGSEPLREFIISFDLTRSPIKELKYERDENRMNIILAPTGPAIRREDVEFRNGALRYDLAVALGVGRIEAANASLARAPELLYEKPVINIDADPKNTAYGEMNLLPESGDPKSNITIPEFAYHILTGLHALPEDRETATLLLAALAAATNGFRLERASPGALRMAGELLERGADAEAIRRYGASDRSLPREQLLARAIARTRWDPDTGTFWSILAREDFEKTGTGRDAAADVLDRIPDFLPPARHYVLLWQDAESPDIAAAVRPAAPDEEPAAKITPGAYRTFREAEAAIGALLRSQGAVE